MKKLIKWLKCTFVDRCSQKKKWQVKYISYDGQATVKCRECGKIKIN